MFLTKKITNSHSSLALLFLLVVVSCGKDPYLYDRAGFDNEARPIVAPNPNAVKTATPDYYQQQQYRSYQQMPRSYPNAQQNYSQFPYQQQVPVYNQVPVYQQQVPYPQYQGQAGSAYYMNPYDIPPAPNYYQRYDVDQYYAPPSYYGSNGNAQESAQGAQRQ